VVVIRGVVAVDEELPGRFGYERGLWISIGVAFLGVFLWVGAAEVLHVRTALISLAVAAVTAVVMAAHAPGDRRVPATVVVLTVASAVLGLLASEYALVAIALHRSYFDVVLSVPLSRVLRLTVTRTDAFSWFIVALSVYSGIRMARRTKRMSVVRDEVPTEAPPETRRCVSKSCPQFHAIVESRQCASCGNATQPTRISDHG
jgi:hypothetical protein